MKVNISFITSNDFRRLCPFVFVMPTSKHKYQRFLILVQKFQCSYIFKNLCGDCFQYKLSSVWSYIFLLNGPDKKPNQNSSKTKRHSPQKEATSVRRRTAVSQRNFLWRVVTGTLHWLARLHCLLYFLAIHSLRPAVLFFFNWTVYLFIKESPIWNYPKKSVIKLKDNSSADNIGLTNSYIIKPEIIEITVVWLNMYLARILVIAFGLRLVCYQTWCRYPCILWNNSTLVFDTTCLWLHLKIICCQETVPAQFYVSNWDNARSDINPWSNI